MRLRTLKNSIHELAESKPLAQAAGQSRLI